MNAPVCPPPPSPTELALEASFLAVALRLQLTPTQHRACENRYRALADWVGRTGSPLEGKMREVYPSGSFAIRAVILASVSRESHDFDAVLEIDVGTGADPEAVLDALFEAIRGERGSRYHAMTRRNSRCVSVTYRDGVTLDLMPVAREAAGPPRAAVLFHHRAAGLGRAEERYRKPVNPWGFADDFNRRVPADPAFAVRVRRLREALSTRPPPTSSPGPTEKAETQPVPSPVPLEEKPPRVMALQLMKRFRDKRYRREDHRIMRKPPAVVLAALALEAGPPGRTLDEELLLLTRCLIRRLGDAIAAGQLLEFRNPAYPPDRFTDRWPESDAAQRLWLGDLRYLEARLVNLRREALSPLQIEAVFRDLFGESVASVAVIGLMLEHHRARAAGESGFEPSGRVAAVSAGATVSTAAQSSPAPVIKPVPRHDFYGGVLD